MIEPYLEGTRTLASVASEAEITLRTAQRPARQVQLGPSSRFEVGLQYRYSKSCFRKVFLMQRRNLLKSLASAGLFSLVKPVMKAEAQSAVAQATRGMGSPKIKDVSVIECAPAGSRLTV
jgi:hypothetical protein